MAKYELLVVSEFSAAHRVRMSSGELEPVHEHDWRVELCIEGRALDDNGLLVDFEMLRFELCRITDEWNGQDLNDLPAFSDGCPSTELIARTVHDRLSPRLPSQVKITSVRIWETSRCAAAFVPDP
jgi:6-pyruvoyltetrahydropterin/6-carboxytetrahydropterin synthase